MSLRHRASLVLIKNETILLIHRENKHGIYYVFPGGGVELGETAEQAVVREAREEAAITIVAEGILVDMVTDYDHNTLVLGHQVGDQEPIWQEHEKQTSEESYKFEWVDVSELAEVNLLPIEGRTAVIAYLNRQKS